jgi:para-nitrobenzyl esterase
MSGPGEGFPASRRMFLAGSAVLAAAPAFGATPSPVARTRYGQVRGMSDNGVLIFRGIPYGASTEGPNRFRAPKPPAAWHGVRDATRFGSASPQHPDGAFDDVPEARRPSEDCLMVNIWTPGLEAAAKRPVMVWFHGGGYAVGSGQERVNDGANLARKQDVVLVTVNHRLNGFGYTYFGDLVPKEEVAANPGMLDLVAALRWVRDNIANFGGDPGNVTIFGQSGGGGKVSTVMAMPSAAGLFHKAILQSGFATSTTPLDVAQAGAVRLFEAAGLRPGDIVGLRRLSTQQMLDAFWKATNGVPLRGAYLVADGDVPPRIPFEAGKPTSSPNVPVLLGSNATETTVLFPPKEAFTVDWAGLPGLLTNASALRPALKIREPGPLIAGFRRAMPGASAADVYFAITTDAGMARNARIVADTRTASSSQPVWKYLVAWRTDVENGRWRAPHGVELPMVFDSVAQKFPTIGNNRPAYQRMADVLSPMWAQFARTGNPNKPGLPEWRPYRAGERATMVFDTQSRTEIDPVGIEMALIDAYY